MSSEQNIRDTVAFADGLRSEDLNWKPIYPNNISLQQGGRRIRPWCCGGLKTGR